MRPGPVLTAAPGPSSRRFGGALRANTRYALPGARLARRLTPAGHRALEEWVGTEREREHAVLDSVGATPRQVRATVIAGGAVLALPAAASALASRAATRIRPAPALRAE